MNHQAYGLVKDLVECLTGLRLKIITLEFRLALADAELCAILEEWHEHLNSPVN